MPLFLWLFLPLNLKKVLQKHLLALTLNKALINKPLLAFGFPPNSVFVFLYSVSE